MPSKKEIELTLEETETALASAAAAEADRLDEQSYWLDQALRSEVPNSVLERAYALHKETNGMRGLAPEVFSSVPFPLEKGGREEFVDSNKKTVPETAKTGETLWGILYREFASGKNLDDPHVADIFNHLPPAAQCHFVDATEDYIRTRAAEEKRTMHKTISLSAPEVDAIKDGDALNLDSVLKNEELLLHLVDKAKEIAVIMEGVIQEHSKKTAEWMRYHQAEPHTEAKLEEILYGPEAAKTFAEPPADEIFKLMQKVKSGSPVGPHEEKAVAETLALYERKIRDRFTMTTSEYIRIRSLPVHTLLEAVPPDKKQLAFITQNAVRPELLNVPDAEFSKRVRIAQLIRAYSFSKELRTITIRQFFRGIVEN